MTEEEKQMEKERQQAEADMKQMKDGFDMIYNTKKPATVAGGLSSGLGNMAKGVAAGGAAWIAMTAVGAKE